MPPHATGGASPARVMVASEPGRCRRGGTPLWHQRTCTRADRGCGVGEITLNDICDAIVDCEHKTAPLTAFGYPSVRTTNIKNGRIDWDNCNRVDEATYQAWTRRREPKPGDLILAREAPVGEVGLIPDDHKAVLGQRTVLICPDRRKVDPRYLHFLLISPDVQSDMLGKATGSTVEHLNMSDIRALPLPELPPLPEQRAIARVLGGLDDKIELNRRMNRTLEDLARGVFRSWFVDFDPVVKPSKGFAGPCKGLAGSGSPRPSSGGGSVPLASPSAGAAPADLFPKRLVDSPLGPIPEGWRVGTVGEEFNLTMGQSPPGSTYNEDGAGVPFYQGRTDFGFRFPTRRVYCTAPTRFAESGDTLVSVRAPVGDINMADERCAAGRGVAAVRHKSGATSYTYAMMAALREAFDVFNGDGTLFGCIGKSDFDKMQVLVPPPEMVAAFERIAGPWDAQITVNEKEARSLAATRDALLPVLLSGEVRLRNEREAERAVGDVLRSTATSTPPERPARPGAGTVHAGAKGGA